jgi:hypothetical protein
LIFMPFVAPWLDVNPRDFVSAAEAGGRLGLSSRSEADDTNLRRQQLAQSAAEQSQRLALEAQGQQTEAQRSNVENQIAQQRSALATQDAMQRFGAQQKYQQTYQQLITSGVSPEDAAMQAALTVGPAGGESISGIAQMMRATAAPKMVDMGGGVKGVMAGGVFHPITNSDIPKGAAGGAMTDVDKMQAEQLNKELSEIDSQTIKLASAPDPDAARVLRMQKEEKEAELQKIISKYNLNSTGTNTPQVKPPQMFIGAPGGKNEIPGYDDSGAKITAPGTPAAGAKIATDDVLKQAMSASGGNKESARQWLQQNGYTIPGSATNAPAAVQPPQIQAPSPSAPKVGIPDIDMATKFQSQEREKRQKQAASSKMARSRQSATEGIEKAQKEIDEYVRQQKYLNRNYSDLAKGFEWIPPQDWDLTPEDRAVKIKAAQDRIAQFKSKLDSLYQ